MGLYQLQDFILREYLLIVLVCSLRKIIIMPNHELTELKDGVCVLTAFPARLFCAGTKEDLNSLRGCRFTAI